MKIMGGISLVMILSATVLSGCAFILGEDDGAGVPGGPRYVETLRNEKSLRGEAFREAQFGTDAATTLQRPTAVYADAFRVYVTDSHLSVSASTTVPVGARVFVFDRGDRTVRILDSSKGVNLLSPSAVVADASGTIFVSDAQQGKIFGFDRNGAPQFTFGRSGDVGSPSGVLLDRLQNVLYIADAHARRIRVVTYNGDWVRDIDGAVDADKGFRAPSALAQDRSGNLFVLDAGAKRMYRYDPSGVMVASFPLLPPTGSALIKPGGIAVDSAGNCYVTDSVSNMILVYDAEGKGPLVWGRTGVMRGEFWEPVGIFIDERDMIYVADRANGRIQVYQTGK